MSHQELLTPLREAEIRAGLTTRRVGTVIHLFQDVESTNDEAAALAGRDEADGALVIAERQRRGRGRLGRRWESPMGLGLYVSVILRPPIPPKSAPMLTLMGSVAGAEAIERTTGLTTALKWPNDLILHGRKVGGILGEMAVGGASLLYVILGIGINANQTEANFAGELREIATSLRIEAGHPLDRTAMARLLIESLDGWYDRLLSDGPRPILEQVRRRCLTVGRMVVARSGDEEVSGFAVELDDLGRLVVRDATGALHHLVAGDVTLAG
ncbi:MAG: biotin--[acetyl-CoA-carboxylase] ligase [Candidatus Methylomirabilota bacterium]|nr:biotin--[acetyl-CoA-carboxylase] ligase [Candidatus Methylomirabilis sp.]NJD69783.1 biotin--[acetyl-CoA-carboxylase] ligase [candidate division NC10 bacterium]PWB44319.1 MAG: biotin--[acetyl-CoA-carboxylase] ligase [candidate division NC10 bacterium]